MQLLRDNEDQIDVRVRADELILLYRMLTDAVENNTYSFLAIQPEYQRDEAEALARRISAILERLGFTPSPE
jgi:hypothetical protein